MGIHRKMDGQWTHNQIDSASKIYGGTIPITGSDVSEVRNKWELKAEAGKSIDGSSSGGKASKTIVFSPNYHALISLTKRAPPVGSRFAFEDLGLQEALLVEGVVIRLENTRYTMLDFKASSWDMVPDTQRRCVLRNNGTPWKAQTFHFRELLGPVKATANTEGAAAQVLRDRPKFDFHKNNSRDFVKNVYKRIAADTKSDS